MTDQLSETTQIYSYKKLCPNKIYLTLFEIQIIKSQFYQHKRNFLKYLHEESKPSLTSSNSLLIAFSDLSTISCNTMMSKCLIMLTIIFTTFSFFIFAIPKFWMLKAPNIIGASITCWFSVL